MTRHYLVRTFTVTTVFSLLAPGLAWSQNVFTHAHYRVPEGQQEAAAEWYNRVLGGEPGEIGPGPGIRHANGFIGTMPNEGMAGDGTVNVLDHVGVSVPDVRAAVELIREMGGEIRTEPQVGITAPLISHVTDPWGGRFELLEDSDYPGINHAHVFASDKDVTRDWFLEVFGGEFVPDRGGDNFHAILYDNVWIHVSQAPADAPRMSSRFRAADHIGFRVPSLDEFRETLQASGYEPYLERPNPPGADLMFFEGPDGLHVEMTEPRPQ